MIVTVKNKQSLMDITTEKYGQIDNLVSVSNDNDLSISEALETNQELTVNSENAGDNEIKDKIITQGFSFNNDFKSDAFNFSLWFLPSVDNLSEMYTNLHVFGVGGFTSISYWSSTEQQANGSDAITFGSGATSLDSKISTNYVRACRSFMNVIGAYNLRDEGPSGGLIFHIDSSGTTYYEAAISDQSSGQAWSNITATLIGTTGSAIGTGAQNTLDIINQAGHTTSAAKLCNDLN